MAVVAATNTSNVPDIEEGTYEFVIVSVEDAEEKANSKYKSDFPRQVVTYKLPEIEGDDGKPITLKQWITLYNPMRPRSWVYRICAAILFGAEEIPEGELVDTDDLVGKRGRLTWGQSTDADGKAKLGIIAIMKPSTRKRRSVTEDEIDNI